VTVSTPSTPSTTKSVAAQGVAALRHSPLADLAKLFAAAEVAGPYGVRLRELPFPAQVNLRTDPADGFVTRRIAAAFGRGLPTVPNTVATTGIRDLLWLGPDEWLVVGPDGDARWIERALRSALAASVVNVSSARTVLELSGPSARAVLEQGCPIDLHPSVFGPGQCAQTLVSRAEVILHQTDDAPTYRLYVRSSYARFLALWLLDAMQEFRHERPESFA
jgi:sarcosine oxidase subunit gamma